MGSAQSPEIELDGEPYLERYRLAAASAGLGVFEWDVDADRLVWDHTLRSIYGSPAGAPSDYAAWQSFIHADDASHCDAALRLALAGKHEFCATFRIIRGNDARTRWVEAHGVVLCDEQGQPQRLIGTQSDVTERERCLQRLRSSELMLREAAAMARVGGWYLDTITNEFFWDDEVRRIHGVGDAFTPSLDTAFSFYDEDSRRELAEAVERALKLGQRFDCVLRFCQSREPERWIRAIGQPEYERGRCVRIAGAFQDVTAQKHNEWESEQARSAAEAASRAKSAFLANMSHEIRTPLTAILGYAELLQEGQLDTREHDASVETILRNGRHLVSVVNEILDLSKIEAGRMSIESFAFSPLEVVEDVVGLMRSLAAEKGLDFGVSYTTKIPATMLGDPLRTRQVLFNLVGNAIKFTDTGTVTILVSSDSESVSFDIRDSGIGMEPSQIETLFEAFTQADASTTRRFGGTGLGLRVSKSLVELMGGQLEADSVLNFGTTMMLRLPHGAASTEDFVEAELELSRRRSHAPRASGDLAKLDGIRVLLAEDSRDNQRLITFLLERAGAVVEHAADGREAVAMTLDARRLGRPYHVVLMDIQMPVLDGAAATRELRQRDYRGSIIALTAHAMSGDRERYIAEGCDDHLAKPIDHRALLRTCQAWGTAKH